MHNYRSDIVVVVTADNAENAVQPVNKHSTTAVARKSDSYYT